MGAFLSVVTGAFFDPTFNSAQVVEQTVSFGAPGQNCLRPKSDQNQSNSALVIEKQPAPLEDLLQLSKTEDLSRPGISSVAQQTLSLGISASHISWNKERIVPWLASNVTIDQPPEQQTMDMENTHPEKTGMLTRTKTIRNLQQMGDESRDSQDATSQVQTKDSTLKVSAMKRGVRALLERRKDFFFNNDSVLATTDESVPLSRRFHLHLLDEGELEHFESFNQE